MVKQIKVTDMTPHSYELVRNPWTPSSLTVQIF